MRTTTRLGLVLLAAVLLAVFLWAISSSPNAAVGQPAPATKGIDADGVAFSLADYRGKVVMLDFWGDW
jgi:hypothetical protein